ncbi:MAG: metalloregulator ArsR/SmtB family transcription factor [Nitrospirota bacterium]
MIKITDDSHGLIAAFKALSNNTRLRILSWLKEPEKHFPRQEAADMREVGVCVKHIQHKVGLSQSTVSLYLTELQEAGLVTVTRLGQWTYYKRDEKGIEALARHIKRSL